MKKINDSVFYLGIFDKERKIFDQLAPLKEGTTYNSYLVKGAEKTALIDTMYAPFAAEYLAEIKSANAKIDYIVANHAEQDHSSLIPALLEIFPEAQVLCSAKCAENLQNMLGVNPEKIRAVADKEEVNLGGKTLRFYMASFVHWPDTMFTYLAEDNMLFTCDFFGAHYTSFELFADNSPALELAAKSYYAEIMMPFAAFCRKHLALAKQINPAMVLPSHGAVYREPKFIFDLYEKWTSTEVSGKVLIAYVSMYGNTKIMAERLENSLKNLGVNAKAIDLMEANEADIAEELIGATGFIFGTSCILAGPHPRLVYLAYLISILKPQLKFYSLIGSIGWGGNLLAPIEANLKIPAIQKIEPLIIKGAPKDSDLVAIDEFAKTLAAKVAEVSGK